nr:MAG TPA: hypothetical protein [Caudoviricetes sp.]
MTTCYKRNTPVCAFCALAPTLTTHRKSPCKQAF